MFDCLFLYSLSYHHRFHADIFNCNSLMVARTRKYVLQSRCNGGVCIDGVSYRFDSGSGHTIQALCSCLQVVEVCNSTPIWRHVSDNCAADHPKTV